MFRPNPRALLTPGPAGTLEDMTPSPRRPGGPPHGAEAFIAGGWTEQQWTTLHATVNASTERDAQYLAAWLRNPGLPALTFRVPITPTMVLDFLARYGKQAPQLLSAVAAGASEQFAVAFLGPDWILTHYSAVFTAWQDATQQLGLSETQAVGWAATGYFAAQQPRPGSRLVPTRHRSGRTNVIIEWTRQFGPDSFLYVLAGITRAEAVTMRDNHTSPTEKQLRVMVALAGHTLPAGV